MMFRKNTRVKQQEIWFCGDVANLLASLDSVPLPSGDYAAGWRNALEAVAVSIGFERVDNGSGPVVWVVPDGQLGAPVIDMMALPSGR